MNKSGTFSFIFMESKSHPIPWDASNKLIQSRLEDLMKNLKTIVSREIVNNFNYRYFVTFPTVFGNLPELQINTSNLVGSKLPWTVESINGDFQYTKIASPREEILEHFTNKCWHELNNCCQ